jgi:phosphoribosyl 1,2-cyclic phosphodiesterase
MKFCILGSGSEGNAILIQTPDVCVLVDAGFSVPVLEKRLRHVGYAPEQIDAVFISHEHIDHIRCLKTLHEKYKVALFANRPTANELRRIFDAPLPFNIFLTNRPFVFKDIMVEPFSVFHDAAEPVGFCITHKDIKLSVATDLGFPSTSVREKMKNSHFLILESNHDEQMLMKSRRPEQLKKRILSRHGHLSNNSAGSLLNHLVHKELKKVILAHLSRECNRPNLAVETIKSILAQNNTIFDDIETAFQDKASAIFTI